MKCKFKKKEECTRALVYVIYIITLIFYMRAEENTSHMFNVKITPLDNTSGEQTLTDGDRFHFKSRVFHPRTLSIDSNF